MLPPHASNLFQNLFPPQARGAARELRRGLADAERRFEAARRAGARVQSAAAACARDLTVASLFRVVVREARPLPYNKNSAIRNPQPAILYRDRASS